MNLDIVFYSFNALIFKNMSDWTLATNGSLNVTMEENGKIILPLVLQYLTPTVWTVN